ncbi:MAG TPA: NAD(P)-binding domain-containing protein [Pyrinomonadaceae bacterium]|nr:NAD(P)-binding domain-containing protein [Pyrinomonadaceae bacterium]
MSKSQLLFVVAALLALLLVNQMTAESFGKSVMGGLPWYGWAGAALLLAAAGALFARQDAERSGRLLASPTPEAEEAAREIHVTKEDLARIDPDGPDYPHPVIFPERCIGCHACVEACPHDVLSIVNGIATPVARDQCMEDTSCQTECPVSPKACIVVNTTKKIPPRKVPQRDARFMTNVAGCYIVGDVSGTPLIKNAANEGADVIRHVAEELRNGAPREPRADYDVAIVGVGPAGLSAAIAAQTLGLRYAAVEQDRVLATIEAYPLNKYVFFKPDAMESRAPLGVEGAGRQREEILESWRGAMERSGVRVNEGESCKSVEPATDGDYFVVRTERGAAKEPREYRARRVVLALGNRGTPMRLRVPGEDLQVVRDGRREAKVRYRLGDAEEYRGRRVVVVGAGNSAVEAAVDLVARRDGERITFRPEGEANDVTLVIRSDFKNDLKFANKVQVYECIDEGRMRVFYGATVKEIREGEVVIMHARTSEVLATLQNDYVFAMIGGERPTGFLESIGIKIG